MNPDYWKRKKVLVTGGTGFLGSHMTQRLFEAGAVVTVATRTGRGRLWQRPFKPDHIEYLQGDLKDPDFADHCTRHKDVVYHFASKIAGLGYNALHPAEMMADNVILDFQVLHAAARNKVPLLFYPSGTLVYDRDLPSPVAEDAPTFGPPVEACKGASWAKRACEAAFPFFLEEYGMNIVHARFSNIYGPGDDCDPETAHLIGNTLHKVANEEPPEVWGDGQQLRAYLYVTDAIEAALMLVEKGAQLGPVNIAGQTEVSVRDVVRMIIEVSGKSLQPRFRPGPTGLQRKLLDIRKFVELTGFRETVGLREGLRNTYEWYLDFNGQPESSRVTAR